MSVLKPIVHIEMLKSFIFNAVLQVICDAEGLILAWFAPASSVTILIAEIAAIVIRPAVADRGFAVCQHYYQRPRSCNAVRAVVS